MTEPNFRMVSDLGADGRWFLEEPRDDHDHLVDPRVFTYGKRVEGHGFLHVKARTMGEPLGLTFADFDMLVADGKTASLLARYADSEIQFIPVRIDSYPGEYSIVNVVARSECIDESRSQFMRWTERDGIPDKVGLYRSFAKLVLDARRIGPHCLFRIAHWEQVIVATRKLKFALEEHLVTGIKFMPLEA